MAATKADSFVSYDRRPEIQYTPSKLKKLRYCLYKPPIIYTTQWTIRVLTFLLNWYIVSQYFPDADIAAAIIWNIPVLILNILLVDLLFGIIWRGGSTILIGTTPWLYAALLAAAVFIPGGNLPPEYTLISNVVIAECFIYRISYNFRMP